MLNLGKKHFKVKYIFLLFKSLFNYFLLFIFFFTNNFISAEVTQLPFITNAKMLVNISSDTANIGDRIEVELLEPINLKEHRVFIPVGSIVSGLVNEAEESQRGQKNGKISVNFTTIHYPNGYVLYVKGSLLNEKTENSFLKEQDKEFHLKGKRTLSQKLFSAGKVGTGAILGGPIGFALAGGTLIFDKGGKIQIKAGEIIRLGINSIDTIDPNFNYSVLNDRHGISTEDATNFDNLNNPYESERIKYNDPYKQRANKDDYILYSKPKFTER